MKPYEYLLSYWMKPKLFCLFKYCFYFRCSEYDGLREHITALHAEQSETLDESVDRKEFSDTENQIKSPIYPLDETSMRSEDPENPVGSSFMCPECGKQFDNIENFSAHAEEQGHGSFDGSCWICGICKAAFFQENELNQHIASHNPLPDQTLEPDDEEPVIGFDNMVPASTSRFLTPEEDLNDSLVDKCDLHYKSEADSSVRDHEIQDEERNSGNDSGNDCESNVVTSSITNEKVPRELPSPDSQMRRELEEMFGDSY